MRELPTYSPDNFQDLKDVRTTTIPTQKKLGSRKGLALPSLMEPPANYDLVNAFRILYGHYFQWSGNQLHIQDGRVLELHELALRFPARHIVRACHADTIAQGLLTPEHALQLPAFIDQLHTTSKGLRTLVERGLSEGHLHFNGIVHADIVWGDQLFRGTSLKVVSDKLDQHDRRLITLGRVTLRLLVLGLLFNAFKFNPEGLPFKMIPLMDHLYFASTTQEEVTWRQGLTTELDLAVKNFANQLEGAGNGKSATKFHWLLNLLMPELCGRWRKPCPGAPSKCQPHRRKLAEHMHLLDRLHLETYLLLTRHSLGKNSGMQSAGEHLSGLPAEAASNQALYQFMHRVFFRYLIFHTHHWQKATQSGKTTGLRHFKGYYDANQRIPSANRMFELSDLAIDRLASSRVLRQIEGRLGPPRGNLARYLPWVLAFANQADKGTLTKMGIVIHFIKSEHPDEDRRMLKRFGSKNGKSFPHRCGLQNIPIVRHQNIRRGVYFQARQLYRLLTKPHPVVPFIVGLDAANLELTTPPEVFAPAFRFLREYPLEMRPRKAFGEGWEAYRHVPHLVKNRQLGMTFHVGEDFRHILSGLRAIHEVIEFMNPLPGDRLGHATALALEPEIWMEQVGHQAILPKQEWLDTLVWLHHLLGPGHDLIGELAIEDKIQLLSKEIYGKTEQFIQLSSREFPSELDDSHQLSEQKLVELIREHLLSLKDPNKHGYLLPEWTPPTLYDAWRLRQLDPFCVNMERLLNNQDPISAPKQFGEERKRWVHVQRKVFKEINKFIGSNAAYYLLNLYWYHRPTIEKGAEIFMEDMFSDKELWLAVCRDAQKKVKAMVQGKQLVIETNPSSNRIIGPMASYEEHPIFNLTLDDNRRLKREVRTTINTDNPGVFATSLMHEYYLLGEILLGQGIAEPIVVKWLEWLRINGEETSFLRATNPDNKKMKELIEAIKNRRRRRGIRRTQLDSSS